MRGDAAVEPANRALHSFLHTCRVGGGGRNNVVELHNNVGAYRALDGHGVFRREKPCTERSVKVSQPYKAPG